MRRRLQLLLYSLIVGGLLLPALMALLPLASNQATAIDATTFNAAKAYCNTAPGGYQSPQGTACMQAYEMATAYKKHVSGAKTESQQCIKTNPNLTWCKNGYEAVINGTSSGSTNAYLAQEIANICSGQSSYDSCKQGVTLYVNKQSENGCSSSGDKTACQQAFQTAKNSLTPAQAQQQATSTSQPTSNTGTDTQSMTCEGSLTGNLTWFLCPVIDLFDGAINVLDGWITQQLTVNTNQIFCSGQNQSCQAYHTAWASFRDIALGLMVIAGLIIVISQAFGAEIVDAYTVKKTLPRILIAAIGITLSWPLMQFFVNFTNALGLGIGHLIYAPFSSFQVGFGFGFGGHGATALGDPMWNFLAGLLGAAAALAAGVVMAGVLISLAGTAALAVFIALTVLILRQVVIILLIILAPVGIVAYILPNTQKTYKFWWESFSKALLMFPLIEGFIAAGRVFSAISLQSHDVIHQLVGFFAYFAPYFLIPATVKLAGGAMRQIGGFVNDRSTGAFDRLRNRRQRQMKQIGQDIRAGQATRWLGGTSPDSFRGKFNRRLAQASHVGSAGFRPSQWKDRINQAISQNDAMGVSKDLINHKAMTKLRGNDNLGEALMRNDFNIDRTRQELTSKFGAEKANHMIAAYQNTAAELRKEGYSERAIQTATYLSGLSASTAHTNKEYDYDQDTGEYLGSGNVANNLLKLSGGDANLQAQLVAAAMEATSERPELAPSFSEGFNALQNIENASGHGAVARQETIKQASKELRRTAIRKKGLRVLFGSGHTARHEAAEYESMLNENYQQVAPLIARHEQAQAAAHAAAEAAAQAAERGEPAAAAEAALDAANSELAASRSALDSSPEYDAHMQMVAEMVAAQKNATNLPLEVRPIVGNLVEHALGPNVTAQSEGYRLRMDPRFQKYVEDFQFAYGARGGAAAAASASQGGAPGAPSGPGSSPSPPLSGF